MLLTHALTLSLSLSLSIVMAWSEGFFEAHDSLSQKSERKNIRRQNRFGSLVSNSRSVVVRWSENWKDFCGRRKETCFKKMTDNRILHRINFKASKSQGTFFVLIGLDLARSLNLLWTEVKLRTKDSVAKTRSQIFEECSRLQWWIIN